MTKPLTVFDRRRLLFGGAALLGASMLSGCEDPGQKAWVRRLLDKDEDANLYVQRLLTSDRKLAPEFTEADLSPWFKPNGTDDPKDKTYRALVKSGFATWRLTLDGLVERPQSWSLVDLRGLKSRTQITRHDCVEGWSAIGKWTGVPLAELLNAAGLKPAARFVVFYCADSMDEGGGGLDAVTDSGDDRPGDDAASGGDVPASGGQTKTKAPDAKVAKSGGGQGDAAQVGSHYYESIDLDDAFHPQTILAYEMNGKPLPVAHGAPLRLRLERQLGYKMAKYVMRIAVVDDLAHIGKGGGGYWEDQGYEWYAGI